MPRAIVRITDHCDNQCLFCAQRGLALPGPDAPGTVLSEARGTSDELMFVGGEPGLVELPRLLALVSEARDVGFRKIGLQTNGRRLSQPGLVARLAHAGLTDLHLSIHGAEASVHDYHVGAQGAFVQALTTLGAARAASLTIGVTTVLTRSNYRVLEPVPRLLRNARVDAWNILVPRTAGAVGTAFERVMPRLAMALPFALHALAAAQGQGLPAFIQGAPACLLGPMAGRALEDEPRVHAAMCEACPSKAHCPGLDEGYLSRFDGDELLARETAPPDGAHSHLRRLFVGVGPLAPAQETVEEAAPAGPLVALGRG